MVAKYYGRFYNADSIRLAAGFNREGASLLGLAEAARDIGFKTQSVQLSYEELVKEAELPCILHWNQNHFVVLCPLPKWNRKKLRIADPSKGMLTILDTDFKQHWVSNGGETAETGTALLLEPTPAFYNSKGEKENKVDWGVFMQYLKKSKWQIAQVCLALLITSTLQLIFPFLTKSVVDVGINGKNLSYITVILIAQLVLVFSRNFVDFIRGRLLLHISSIINLSILSDFWYKLTRLPLSYFSKHHTGDIMQRIGDHRQIQDFLTGTAINAVFSLVTFTVFAVVLAAYNMIFFIIFAAGTIFYYGWVHLFLRIRRNINYQTFHLSAKENNATMQLVHGMQEIKLHNAERAKRWEWEEIQAKIFNLNFRNLSYTQLQQAGALLINQGKDVLITCMVARLVVKGELSLGTMLAIQFIIGQLSGPVEQFVSFIQHGQDAKIGMERLNEIHQMKDEEVAGKSYVASLHYDDIRIENMSFTYTGAGNSPVIKNLNLIVPKGKVTAIVGLSGNGKTTLIKILLKFFDEYEGEIKIGQHNFKDIRPSDWRRQCSAVLQNGYIFNDSIARNIAIGDDEVDYAELKQSCHTANILSFIESLPNGFNTRLGADGTDMSEGQKQRLLIARAVYKKPEYLFFDEATNALDAKNEKVIVENLKTFFTGRTVIVVAHRLSTVKDADKIIMLEDGRIAEEGSHQYLSAFKGKYYELVKNQLEMGS
jgi:ATP-binding cassette subfamily B protein